LSLVVDEDDVLGRVDENGGNGKFSMPTSTGGMMAVFCSSVETTTMSRSVKIRKKEEVNEDKKKKKKVL
jgi:hypothetical protein